MIVGCKPFMSLYVCWFACCIISIIVTCSLDIGFTFLAIGGVLVTVTVKYTYVF